MAAQASGRTIVLEGQQGDCCDRGHAGNCPRAPPLLLLLLLLLSLGLARGLSAGRGRVTSQL